MKKNIFQIYALLVCLITTVIMIISLSLMLYSTLEVVIPEYVRYSSLSKYNSNDEFKSSYAYSPEKLKNKSDQEIEQIRVQEKAHEINHIKSQGLESFIKAILWLFVSIPFFFIHWRINARL